MNKKIKVFIVCLITTSVVTYSSDSQLQEAESLEINPKTLKNEVKNISENFFPRNYNNPKVLNELSEYIFDRFRTYASKVDFQNYSASDYTFRNVVAKFGPETNKVIVIGAHYDSYSLLPGADDNASGVAGLLELSRLISKVDLQHQVQLVAYCTEEPPFFGTESMGSYIHAKSLKDQNKEVEIMISLEMIGFFTDEEDSQAYPLSMLENIYPATGHFIAVVDQLFSRKAEEIKNVFNNQTNIEAHSINAPKFLTGVDFSDHRNYWKLNYPAVMITDTAFFRNKNYHRRSDTYDTLDYKKMAEVISGVYKYLMIVASTGRPQPTEAS